MLDEPDFDFENRVGALNNLVVRRLVRLCVAGSDGHAAAVLTEAGERVCEVAFG